MKHIVISTPILSEKDAKGNQSPLGVTFLPSKQTAADADARAAAVKAGMTIDLANAVTAAPAVVAALAQPSTEYHLIVADAFDHAGATYAATWDGVSPYVTVLVGDQHALRHGFLGWPMVTKAEWTAMQPVVVSPVTDVPIIN